MIHESISTKNVSEKQCAIFWQKLVSNRVLGLDIEGQSQSKDIPFHGAIQKISTSNIRLINIDCSHSVNTIRSKRLISASSKDDYIFCFQKKGTANLHIKRELITCRPCEWVLCDCSQPFTWFFPMEHVQFVLRISKQKLENRLLDSENIIGKTISGQNGLGKIAWQMVKSIWTEMKYNRIFLNSELESVLVELLSTSLNNAIDHTESVTPSQTMLQLKILSFINDQLSNPDLSVKLIAEEFNYSIRYIHQLFENQKIKIAKLIRGLRLEKCKIDIENPSFKNRTLTEIAFSWGFNDSSHFSKLFKKRFGYSPKQGRVVKIRK